MQARRRRLAAALGACVALVGLSGCDKPTPIVTLHSGNGTVDDSAFSYCFSGQDPSKQPGTSGACRYDTGRTPQVLRVRPGDEVLIDVDKDLADSGWFVALKGGDGQEQRSATQDGHVFSFQPDFSQAKTLTVNVRKQTSAKENAPVVGLWTFTVVPG